jgi:ferredoxin
MPKLTIEEAGTYEVPQGKRLVNALSDEAGLDQLHACGGNARCTTCRVQFTAAEPQRITQAEKELLAARGLTVHPGLRLSCQIVVENDMTVKAISRLAGSGRADAGKRPADDIQPPPVWTEK